MSKSKETGKISREGMKRLNEQGAADARNWKSFYKSWQDAHDAKVRERLEAQRKGEIRGACICTGFIEQLERLPRS